MVTLFQKLTAGPIPDAEHVNPPMIRTVYTFDIAGPVAALVEQAEHASFYGIHAGTREAGQARRAIIDAVTPIINGLDALACSLYIRQARSASTEGTPTPYRAEIEVEVDSLT